VTRGLFLREIDVCIYKGASNSPAGEDMARCVGGPARAVLVEVAVAKAEYHEIDWCTKSDAYQPG